MKSRNQKQEQCSGEERENGVVAPIEQKQRSLTYWTRSQVSENSPLTGVYRSKMLESKYSFGEVVTQNPLPI